MSIRQDQLIFKLNHLRACDAAISWVRDDGIQTLAEAWQKCKEPMWMEWYIDIVRLRTGIPEDKIKKYKKAEKRLFSLCWTNRITNEEYVKRVLACIRRHFPKPPYYRYRKGK